MYIIYIYILFKLKYYYLVAVDFGAQNIRDLYHTYTILHYLRRTRKFQQSYGIIRYRALPRLLSS